MAPRPARVPVACAVCGVVRWVRPSVLERGAGAGHFCSRACASRARITLVAVPCQVCGVVRLVEPSALRRGAKYCSRSCANRDREITESCRAKHRALLTDEQQRKLRSGKLRQFLGASPGPPVEPAPELPDELPDRAALLAARREAIRARATPVAQVTGKRGGPSITRRFAIGLPPAGQRQWRPR